MNTYKDLIVWQKSMKLVDAVYELTAKFPKDERYGMISQMQRAAGSIAYNIAEGKMRSKGDFKRFLLFAYGSGAELETQVELAKRRIEMKHLDYAKVDVLLLEVMKML